MRSRVRSQMCRSLWMMSVFLSGSLWSSASGISLYVASGNAVGAYTLGGTLEQSFTPSVSWANAFAITVDSSGNVYIADAGANRIVQFNSAGTQTGVLQIPADSTGGTISPQEIALDASGNLYSTSFNGDIRKFASATGSGSTLETIAGARGILVNGGDTYVSTSAYGAATVSSFATGSGGTVSTLYTTGSYPAGQLRGMAADVSGNLYIADSTWVAGQGTIVKRDSGGTVTGLISGLNGPNAIAINGSSLYVASYFGGDVKSYDIVTGAYLATIVSSLGHISGIAFGPSFATDGFQTITDAIEPEFFQVQHSNAPSVPEPGTVALLASAAIFLALARRARA